MGALASLGLAACGGGTGSAADLTPTTTPTSTVIMASVDIDQDGRTDLLSFAHTTRGGSADVTCWQAEGDGFVLRPSWRDHPTVRAVLTDARGRSEFELTTDEGIHRARGSVSGASRLPYAVLDVGPDDGEPLGAPVIDTLAPDAGSTNTLVMIRGADLAERDALTTVTFDGISAEVLVARPKFVLTLVPGGLPTGDVGVVVTRDGEASAATTFTVVATPTPTLDSLHPVPLVVDSLAIVTGTHLGTPLDDVTVTLGATTVTRFLPLGRRLILEVPLTATEGPLVVTVNGVASDPLPVTIVSTAPAPTIETLTPASASPGSIVRIDGTHLFAWGERLAVKFGEVEAALFSVRPGTIWAIVPATAASDDITVEVGERVSAGSPFTVVPRGLPTIARIDPTSAAAGAMIEIDGTDLYDLSAWRPGRFPPLRAPFGDVEVRFAGTQAFFLIPTEHGLRVRVPRDATSGDVTVQVGVDTSTPAAFTVN